MIKPLFHIHLLVVSVLLTSVSSILLFFKTGNLFLDLVCSCVFGFVLATIILIFIKEFRYLKWFRAFFYFNKYTVNSNLYDENYHTYINFNEEELSLMNRKLHDERNFAFNGKFYIRGHNISILNNRKHIDYSSYFLMNKNYKNENEFFHAIEDINIDKINQLLKEKKVLLGKEHLHFLLHINPNKKDCEHILFIFKEYIHPLMFKNDVFSDYLKSLVKWSITHNQYFCRFIFENFSEDFKSDIHLLESFSDLCCCGSESIFNDYYNLFERINIEKIQGYNFGFMFECIDREFSPTTVNRVLQKKDFVEKLKNRPIYYNLVEKTIIKNKAALF